MKAMPKKELITLITQRLNDIVFKDDMNALFEKFGDDYYRDMGDYQWELTFPNQHRASEIKREHFAEEQTFGVRPLSEYEFPIDKTKVLFFTKDSDKAHTGRYDFNELMERRWIDKDGNEYTSDKILLWKKIN